MFPFGQDITFWYYPMVGDDPATIPTAMQTQTPAIYVYADKPTIAQAQAGTGSPVSTLINSWTWDAAKNGWSFTVPAVADPQNTSEAQKETYWVAITFRLQAGGQPQTVFKALELVRVFGHHTAVGVTGDDLKRLYQAIDAYGTPAQQLDYTNQATADVQARLTAAGYEWGKLHRLDRLKRAVALKAVSLLMLNQQQAPNDKFYVKYVEFKEMYSDAIDTLKIEYDADKDGQPDTVAETGSRTILLVR